jgi:hypothetical protein
VNTKLRAASRQILDYHHYGATQHGPKARCVQRELERRRKLRFRIGFGPLEIEKPWRLTVPREEKP